MDNKTASQRGNGKKIVKMMLTFLIIHLCLSAAFAQSGWTSPFLKPYKEETSSSQSTYSNLVKERPVKILVTRPVTKYGETALEDKWVLVLCENLFFFRLGGIEAISVVDQETLAQLITDYQDYQRPIPFDNYLEAAKKLSVHYIIYLQCEHSRFISDGQVSIGADINFFGKVIAPNNDVPIFVESKQFDLQKMGDKLDNFLVKALKKLEIEITDKNRNFLETPIMPGRVKNIKKLGEYLSLVYESETIDWNRVFKRYRKLLKRNPEMLIGYYSGVKMGEIAGKYKDAAHLSHTLMELMDTSYPCAFIETCKFYRLCGKYEQAWKIIESVPDINHLKNDVKMEKAFLYEQKGEVKKAADMALEVLREDSNNKKARLFYKQNNMGKEKTLSTTNEKK